MTGRKSSFIKRSQQRYLKTSTPYLKSQSRSEPWHTLYKDAPMHDLQLEQLASYAVDRLRLLRGIEDCKSRGKSNEELRVRVRKLLSDMFPRCQPGSAQEEANHKKDRASHYVLRLACCRTEELRRWMLQYECDLLRVRLWEYPDLIKELLACVGLDSEEHVPSRVELADVAHLLRQQVAANARQAVSEADVASLTFYKLPFEAVPDLVMQRKVLLRKGFAFVTQEQMTSAIISRYRTQLSKALVLTSRAWQAHKEAQEADRLGPLLTAIPTWYLGPQYGGTAGASGEVRLAELPSLAATAFPLCMQQLMERGHQDHHLRHQGRQQLGLFLKAIGLSLEEALVFWRQMFTHKITHDKFDKEYAYNIRHNYGREGKRESYNAHSCVKIVGTVPPRGECHGCPYRTMAEPQLRSALGKLQIKQRSIDNAVQAAKQGHFQIACTHVFEGRYGEEPGMGIQHPNQFFEEAQRILKAKAGATPSGAPTPATTATPQKGLPPMGPAGATPGSSTVGASSISPSPMQRSRAPGSYGQPRHTPA